MGIKSRRVAFTFDDGSVKTLQQMTEEGAYSSLADCVRESLLITQALQRGAQQGFAQLIVRNPHTRAEREIVIPRRRLIKETP